MEFNIETIWRVLSIFSLIVSLGSVLAVYMNSPGRKLEGGLKELTTSVDAHKDVVQRSLKGHDRRIQAVEDELKHLPTSDEFAELQNSLTRVAGDTKLNTEMLSWLKNTVQSMDNYLRANK